MLWHKVKPLLIILSVALNVAFVGSWTQARLQGEGVSPVEASPDGRPATGYPLHRRLGVTSEQCCQLAPQFAEFQFQQREICQRIAKARRQILDLLVAQEPDREAIRQAETEIVAAQQEMQGLVISQLLAQKEVLTAEQQRHLFRLIVNAGECMNQCERR